MVRSRSSRKRARKKRAKRSLRMAFPRIDMMYNVQKYYHRILVGTQSGINVLTVRQIMDQLTGLRDVYYNVRVDCLRFYYSPDSAPLGPVTLSLNNHKGFIALVVCDYLENQMLDRFVTASQITTLVDQPGVCVRKAHLPVSATWYPTEPSDHAFKTVESDRKITSWTIFGASQNPFEFYIPSGYVTIDVDLTLRGRRIHWQSEVGHSRVPSTKVGSELPRDDSLEESVESLSVSSLDRDFEHLNWIEDY